MDNGKYTNFEKTNKKIAGFARIDSTNKYILGWVR